MEYSNPKQVVENNTSALAKRLRQQQHPCSRRVGPAASKDARTRKCTNPKRIAIAAKMYYKLKLLGQMLGLTPFSLCPFAIPRAKNSNGKQELSKAKKSPQILKL